jgi:methyltransferase family protein
MESPIAIAELPSQRFQPRIYGVGAWTEHLHFAYDLVAKERPAFLVELGTDRGESYFAFCQSVAENQTGTRCFAVDTWKGDAQSGFYEEITFQQVEAHNRQHYQDFSTLLRRDFDHALKEFGDGKIDILHLDGLHSEEVVRHDLDWWLPKLSPSGILLLHDVVVHNRGFGVWRVWKKFKKRGRWFTFEEGAGLGVWEKRPKRNSIFRNSFLDPTSETRIALVEYYQARGRELKERIANEWRTGAIRQSPFAQETVVQIFHTKDGTHREEDSVYARIGHDAWKDISISLSPGIGTVPLRIDLVSALTVIDIAQLRVTRSGQDYFRAKNPGEFDKIDVRGDAQRLPHPNFLRLRITGIDPQLYLPPIAPGAGTGKTTVEIRVRVHAATPPGD